MFAYVPEIHNDDEDDCSIPLENYEYDVVEDDNDDVVCVCVPWQPCALLTYATTEKRNNDKNVSPQGQCVYMQCQSVLLKNAQLLQNHH